MTGQGGERNKRVAAKGSQAEGLLDALVALMSVWSSLPVQGAIAASMGLEINEADVRTLHTLGRLGAVRPARVADELHLTRPTASKSIGRLAAAGLVTRRPAADDGRAVEVELTDLGRAGYRGLVEAGIAMVDRALSEVPLAEGEAASIVRFAAALRESTRT